jgi:hypothetical protein
MTIKEIQAGEYEKYLPDSCIIYARSVFNQLNSYKVDKVIYLLFQDTKSRFVMCFGVKENAILCPYSAPFGMIIPIKTEVSLSYYYEALKELEIYARESKYHHIRMVLPPAFYDDSCINMWINTLYNNGFTVKHIDINYQLNISNIDLNSYMDDIQHNARKNLKISLRSGLSLCKCLTETDKQTAYEVIRLNRESKGYPLRMTYSQVAETIKILDHDFFVVKVGEVPIASAIVFCITEQIYQVIYWGDVPGYSQYKPINYLSYKLIEYYKQKNIRYLDIGPSSESGIPNFGLCDFKQSIGCETSCKFTFEKALSE